MKSDFRALYYSHIDVKDLARRRRAIAKRVKMDKKKVKRERLMFKD